MTAPLQPFPYSSAGAVPGPWLAPPRSERSLGIAFPMAYCSPNAPR
jgi:hypothetical protein